MTTREKVAIAADMVAVLAGSGGPASRPIPRSAGASKGSSAYQVHTYPTKVPPAAIEPFIEASTEPGGTVMDPFCGSGMTGLAALNTGRRPILSDLAPGAVHLAHNATHPVDPESLAAAAVAITSALAKLETTLYQTACPTCGGPGLLRHIVWSEVHSCGGCGRKLVIWDQADDTGDSSKLLVCSCGHVQSRSGVADAISEPVEKTVHCPPCRKLQHGPVDEADLERLALISRKRLTCWMPSVPMGPDREMYRRSALQLHGIKNVRDFWIQRTKLALSALWRSINEVPDADVRSALRFAFTNTAWHTTRMRRFNSAGGQRPLTGTLYIPQLITESNVFEIYRNQVKQIGRFYKAHPALERDDLVAVTRQSSATSLSWLPDDSADYVFTDPPFGANLFYGDCNIVWESWLGDVTNLEQEIVVNRSLPLSNGGKTVEDYERLLGDAFSEVARVVKPEARISVVFHNSDDSVWSALLAATDRAGLAQTDVGVLDKKQRSQKGYKGRSGAERVPFYDLVITFKTGARAPSGHLNGAGAIALDAVTSHLKRLPVAAPAEATNERSLEYLYSLSVGAVISSGHELTGLSFQALEGLLRENFQSDGRHFYLG